MDKYFFKTEKLAVGYDGRTLISDIDIELEKGKILTLIGPNGAGKSTILKSITKQLSLVSGVVEIDGLSIDDMTEKQLAQRLSLVLTERLRPEMMSCRDMVETGRYPYTGRLGVLSENDHARVTEAMELVQVSELSERDFLNISDGQRQRVMLARAICQEPDIIILDEPTSFLDVRHKLKLLEILRNLVHTQGLTVIMSMHELELAQKISDFVMCVKGSYIDKYGSPEEVFTGKSVEELYDLQQGAYNPVFGSVELPPSPGAPEVFIIAGGASGSAEFRRLQREGIPFATGVLHESDADYLLAKAIANEVISETAFMPISEENYQRARAVMLGCEKVICCIDEFGPMNEKNKLLFEEAEKCHLI